MEHPPGAQLFDRLTALLGAQSESGSAVSASLASLPHASPQSAPQSALPSASRSGSEGCGITLRPVACLAACDRGCTAAIAMPGRWTWLLGHLGPEKAEDLLVYAQLYAASAKGTVMPSRRPASLADMILGRVPVLLYPEAIVSEQEPS